MIDLFVLNHIKTQVSSKTLPWWCTKCVHTNKLEAPSIKLFDGHFPAITVWPMSAPFQKTSRLCTSSIGHFFSFLSLVSKMKSYANFFYVFELFLPHYKQIKYINFSHERFCTRPQFKTANQKSTQMVLLTFVVTIALCR